MKFFSEIIYAIIPRTKDSDIIVRKEVNEYDDIVIDIRLRKMIDGESKYSRHGITFPISLKNLIIEALQKIED